MAVAGGGSGLLLLPVLPLLVLVVMADAVVVVTAKSEGALLGTAFFLLFRLVSFGLLGWR